MAVMEESEKWWFDCISDDEKQSEEEPEDFGVARGIDYPATLRRSTTLIIF